MSDIDPEEVRRRLDDAFDWRDRPIHAAAREWLRLREQIDELARFIMEEIPGEPSQSEGAVDTAIRLLRLREQPATACSFCGERHTDEKFFTPDRHACICDECVAALAKHFKQPAPDVQHPVGYPETVENIYDDAALNMARHQGRIDGWKVGAEQTDKILRAQYHRALADKQPARDVQAQDAMREVFDATRRLCRDIIIEVGPEDDGTRDEMLTRLDEMQELWPLAEAVAVQAQIDAAWARGMKIGLQRSDEAIDAAVARERKVIEARLRQTAECYPQSSDGRNTFLLEADWVRARSAKGVS